MTTHKSEGKRRIASSAEPVGGQLDLPISELEADPPRPNRKLLLSLSVSNGRQQDESDKQYDEAPQGLAHLNSFSQRKRCERVIDGCFS